MERLSRAGRRRPSGALGKKPPSTDRELTRLARRCEVGDQRFPQQVAALVTRRWTRTSPRTPRRRRQSSSATAPPHDSGAAPPRPAGGGDRRELPPPRGAPGTPRGEAEVRTGRALAPEQPLFAPALAPASGAKPEFLCMPPSGRKSRRSDPSCRALAVRAVPGRTGPAESKRRTAGVSQTSPSVSAPGATARQLGGRTCSVTWEASWEAGPLHTAAFQKPKTKGSCRPGTSACHPCQASRSRGLSSSPGVP